MINFSDLTDVEQQAFADYQYKELTRHQADIENIKDDLKEIERRYGIKPRPIYCEWIEVKE